MTLEAIYQNWNLTKTHAIGVLCRCDVCEQVWQRLWTLVKKHGKSMMVVDCKGLPLSVNTHAANHHEAKLAQRNFDFYMIESKPDALIGNGAHNSDSLDEELQEEGIKMVALHRKNQKKIKNSGWSLSLSTQMDCGAIFFA